MKRVLFVDDDAVILGLYQKALAQSGYNVETATDGIAAVQSLRTARPDVVVLDLMMPKFSGVDVLRFVRADASLRELPVIVLTNCYLDDLATKAAGLGIKQAFLKVDCTPTRLVTAIEHALSGCSGSANPAHDPAHPQAAQNSPITSASNASAPTPTPSPAPAVTTAPAPPSGDDLTAAARQSLIANADRTRNELHALAQELFRAQQETECDPRLQSLHRRVGHLGATAGLGECHSIALLASAFEALLFELIHRPELITPSVRRTIIFTVDFIGLMLEHAPRIVTLPSRVAQVLVVDDDPLSNRLITSALRREQLNARSTEDPATALQWARETHFDLCLLDIEMPALDGFELCKQLRALPGYQHVPVIFVTSHSDFEHRAKSVLSGGNDLIAKPVLPTELGVKALTHVLRGSIQASGSAT